MMHRPQRTRVGRGGGAPPPQLRQRRLRLQPPLCHEDGGGQRGAARHALGAVDEHPAAGGARLLLRPERGGHKGHRGRQVLQQVGLLRVCQVNQVPLAAGQLLMVHRGGVVHRRLQRGRAADGT